MAERAAQLRKMITREDFETLIGRDVRDIVRKYFRLLPPDQQQGALRGTRALEEAIADQLGHHRALGLTLASSRPVMVNVRQLPRRPTRSRGRPVRSRCSSHRRQSRQRRSHHHPKRPRLRRSARRPRRRLLTIRPP